MGSRTWYTGLAAAAAFSALIAAPSQAASVFVQIAPPAPQVEVVPAPRQGQVWVPGHWKWNGVQHVWVPGHFQQRRVGYIWAPARWVQVGGRWEFREGAWVRAGNTCRDSDGDGICDRFDATPGGPGPGAPVIVQIAPPAPQVEVRPAPRPGNTWIPGHWQWNGNQYVWRAGYWQTRRAGLVYIPDRWVQWQGRWVFKPGMWVRPDGRVRDDDGDGLADAWDKDRDNDGLPDRMDRAPNTPNR